MDKDLTCGVAGCREPATRYDSYAKIVMCSRHAGQVAPEFIRPLGRSPAFPRTAEELENMGFLRGFGSYAVPNDAMQPMVSAGGPTLTPTLTPAVPPVPICFGHKNICFGHKKSTVRDGCYVDLKCRETTRGGLVTREEAALPPPETVPAKRGREYHFHWTYCENAPPRKLVEQTVAILDGDECGGVPRTPFLETHLCWTSRQQRAWEHHEEVSKRTRGDLMIWTVDGCGNDDSNVPTGPDLYGSIVLRLPERKGEKTTWPYRCRVCGGWMRTKPYNTNKGG